MYIINQILKEGNRGYEILQNKRNVTLSNQSNISKGFTDFRKSDL